MRGQPQTVSALTTASTDDVLAVLYVKADAANVGEVMRRMLARFNDAAVLVFDPVSKRIIGTTNIATQNSLLSIWTAAVSGQTIVSPVGAGVLTLYTASQDDLGIAGTIANAIQKRTFYGLVGAALGLWGRATPAQTEPACLVDQVTGQIRIAFLDLSALDSLTPAGQTVCVQFAPDQPQLIFE